MSSIESRLAELGVTLPDAPAPAANYVPFVQVGNLVHISGQISANASGQIKGKLGADLSIEQGAEAAKACAISLLAQLKKACGLCELHRRFHRSTESHQRRFRFHGRRLG